MAEKHSKKLNSGEVKEVLLQKIEEERSSFASGEIEIPQDSLPYIDGKFNVLSLFSGCGGLDLGVELAGIAEVLGEENASKAHATREDYLKLKNKGIFHAFYANDFFKEALETYGKNAGDKTFIHRADIRRIKEFPKADLVLGGFPCPGFSEAGPRLIDDPRNFLYLHFIRCLMQAKPYIFVAENVKGMLTLGKGEVFRQIVEDFSAAGYNVVSQLVNARDYGVPQLRERVILVGVRKDLDFQYIFPEATHGTAPDKIPYVSLKDAIGDLAKSPGEYFEGGFSSIYLSRNRKKRWDEQSFTIQASGRQAPLHPDGDPMEKVGRDSWELKGKLNRRLSVKEIARIQTFPDWYYFSDGGNSEISANGRLDKVYKQIGSAVPVFLGKAIASPIARFATEVLKKRMSRE